MAFIGLYVCIALLCSLYIVTASSKPQYWKITAKTQGDEPISFRIALKQRNIDVLKGLVLEYADPNSPSYGRSLSTDEVLHMISPTSSDVEVVQQYLIDHSILDCKYYGDNIQVQATVRDVEKLLSVKMVFFQNTNGQRVIRSSYPYTTPHPLDQYVDIITGVSELPNYGRKRVSNDDVNKNVVNQGVSKNVVDQSVSKNVDNEDGMIVPQLLQKLYNMPHEFNVHKSSSLCVVEFLDDTSYDLADLKAFANGMNVTYFQPTKNIGPFASDSPDAESTLDVQYAGAMALNTSLWFWTEWRWLYEFANDLFHTNEAPWVVSMSWGWPEDWQCQSAIGNCSSSEAYVKRVNTEYLKLAARRITLLASSGDQGAPGDMNNECNNVKHPLSNLFPASSPWVTAVGATMLDKSDNKIHYDLPPFCLNNTCATHGKETACTFPQALITTGGGFSTFSPVPEWQYEAVSKYLNSGVALPPNSYFNASNRAYPDISGLGHNYLIQYSGLTMPVDGTSCSSPVMAGMIALLNSVRFNLGKPALGFINPLLYDAAVKSPSAYNSDITGNNKCTEACCTKNGFEAVKHVWNPVVGLGTPNFALLQKYVESLPQ